MKVSVSRLGWLIAAVLTVLALAATAVVLTSRDGDSGRGTATSAPRVVGYFAQWGVYARNYPVKKVLTSGSAARLSHLVYAFGSTAGGRCGVGDPVADYERIVSAQDSVDGVADTSATPLRGNFGQLRKLKARQPHLKVLWSFGGWTGSEGFTAAARDPDGFAESCRRLLDDPRWAGIFDGIDIDWEYPNACGRTCDSSGPDAPVRLAAALRTAFGADALVTAAITGDAGPGGKLAAADYAGAAGHFDWVMAMTYDYFGTGKTPGPTAPHSPLTPYPGIPRQGASAEEAIGRLLQAGVPADKILLGIGFYGRGWTGVTQATPGGRADGPAPGTHDVGVEDYRVLRDRCPATGTIGGTAYALCGGQWWSYDTPDTVRAKMAYARSRQLGGAFVWDLSGDTADGELLAALSTGLNAR